MTHILLSYWYALKIPTHSQLPRPEYCVNNVALYRSAALEMRTVIRH